MIEPAFRTGTIVGEPGSTPTPGMRVTVHVGREPVMSYNVGRLVVNKGEAPSSHVFCVEPERIQLDPMTSDETDS